MRKSSFFALNRETPDVDSLKHGGIGVLYFGDMSIPFNSSSDDIS